MTPIRECLRRLWYLLNRRRMDEALRREMEAHLAEMGQPARFGNVLRLREESRDVWGWRWLDRFWRDIALALRTLRRSPLFTFTAVTILAVGIGVNLGFFHLVSSTLLRPPAIKDPQTVAQFYRRSQNSRSSSVPAPLADFVRQQNRTLSAVLTSARRFVTWGDDGGRQVEAAFVSANWFDELGATAETGQLFHPHAADSAAGATPPFIVLSYELWRRDFGSRADIAGTIVRINDRPATVLGVVGRRFDGVDFARPGVWLPIQTIVDNPPLGPTRNDSRWSSAPGLSVSRHAVNPEFFSLMRIPILLGRTFRPGDDPTAVVIISEAVAIRMCGQRDVIGREFPRDDGASQRRIIGVARDAHLHEPHATNAGEQYTLLSPDEAGTALLLVRARSDAARVLGPMRQASRAVAAQIAPATRLMRADFAQTVLAPSVARSVAAAIAMLALFMAALGIAGLVSYVARLRTKEMGIRMALGASPGAILRALLGRTGAVALIGAVVGLTGGWAVGHVFAGDPFYLKPLDVFPYASAALTLSLSASAAALLPAIRVLHTDPLRALRVD